MTIERILARELIISPLYAKKLAIKAKLELRVSGPPNPEQEIAIVERALVLRLEGFQDPGGEGSHLANKIRQITVDVESPPFDFGVARECSESSDISGELF